MPKYRIPIVYQRMETFEVEADSLEEAMIKSAKDFLAIPDEKYLEDSFEFDEIIYDEYKEKVNITKVFNNI